MGESDAFRHRDEEREELAELEREYRAQMRPYLGLDERDPLLRLDGTLKD